MEFVDPIIRQTLPDGTPRNCSDPIKNFFQMDMDQKDSWYSLTPEMTQRQTCSIHPERHFSFYHAKVPPISQSWNAYERTTQRILGRYPNEFNIKECLTKIYTELDSLFKRKKAQTDTLIMHPEQTSS